MCDLVEAKMLFPEMSAEMIAGGPLGMIEAVKEIQRSCVIEKQDK